jgi:hypothetical protein
VHAHITGSALGRRWGTRQLNQALFVALMAQFQAYCRGLHDEGVEVHVAHAVPSQREMLKILLTQGRKLEVTNPRRSVLGADFGRLGVSLVGELKAAGPATVRRLDLLEALVDFRNAVGHGDDPRIAAAEEGGVCSSHGAGTT